MTTNSNNSWRQLSLEFDKGVHSALLHQHHAIQLISLAGKYLIPQQPDDSNTNMQYQSAGEWIIGNELPRGFRIALDLSQLKLLIINNSKKPYTEIEVACRTKSDVFDNMKEKLSGLGIDVSDLSMQLHYEIPGHELDGKAAFFMDSEQDIRENIYYRHNAEIVISKASGKFPNAEPVRIWPHHFDTGSLVPIEKNDAGAVSRSVGLGLAIPDNMVDEPYYYLSYWSESPVEDFGKLPDPDAGEWIRTGWNGGIVRNSDILKISGAEGQQEFVESFFNSGIEILRQQYNF